MMLRAALFLVLVLAATLPPLHAQDTWWKEQFTSLDGLPQNSIVSMAVDVNGYLLLSTEGGVVRYDGSRFRPVPLMGDEGATGGRTRDLVVLWGGDIAVRDASNHAYLIRNDRAEPVLPHRAMSETPLALYGGVPTVRIFNRLLDPDHPLPGWQPAPWSTLSTIPSSYRDWMAFGTQDVLFYRDTTLVRTVPAPEGAAAAFTTSAGIFVLSRSAQAYLFQPGTGTFTPVVALGMPVIGTSRNWSWHWQTGQEAACLSIGGAAWKTWPTPSGDTLHFEPLDLGLPEGCSITAMKLSEDGNMMAVGTDLQGLFIYRRNAMRTVSSSITKNNFYGQAIIGPDRIMGLNIGSPVVFNGEGRELGRVSALQDVHGESIGTDMQGRFLYTQSDRLLRFDPEDGTHVVLDRHAYHGAGSYFTEGDSVWVGTYAGLGCVIKDKYHLAVADTASDWTHVPKSFCRDLDGRLLMACCAGLYRLEADGTKIKVDGFTAHCPRVLYRSGERIHVGTYGDGAFIIDRKGIHRLPMDRQGFLSHVHAFMPDANGYMWMSTNQGLFRVRIAEVDAWLQDTTRSIYYGRYGQEDGILNAEFNGACTPEYVRRPDGMASFPTMGGLVWFHPEQVPDPFPAKPLRFEEVAVDGKEHSLSQPLELAADHRELRIDFSLLYWGSPENVHLEYDLEGQTAGWEPLEWNARHLVMQRLPPGPHHLRIRKVGADVRGDKGGLDLRFTVAYPFYSTWWGLGSGVLALGGLFWLLMRFNAVRLRRRNLVLERHVRERTTALQNANNTLRQWVEVKETLVSVISHDIVAPLRFIARVSGGALREGVQERYASTLSDISHSSDRLYNHAQNLLNWVKHQQGHLEVRLLHIPLNALVAEALDVVRAQAANKGLELVNEVSYDDVLRSDRDILIIILQNLLSNAVAHTSHGRIVVAGSMDDTTYRLSVSDTGPGMPAEVVERIRRNDPQQRPANGEPPQGLGYMIIQTLLPLLKGDLKVDTSKGRGTTIHIVLPTSL